MDAIKQTIENASCEQDLTSKRLQIKNSWVKCRWVLILLSNVSHDTEALILSASVTIEYFYISTKRNVWSMAIHNRFMNIGAINLITVTVFSCIKLYIKMKKTESTTNVYQFMKHVYCVIIHI